MKAADIRHVHKFIIEGNEIELDIARVGGVWRSDIIKDKTGMGQSSGGKFDTLDDYIKKLESDHRYAYNFFNHGYKYAKEQKR